MDGIRKTEEQLFEAARKLAGAAQRRAFLQAACQDDPALRQRVEQLLEDLPAADEFFTDARVEPPTPAAVLGQMTEKPGDRIGRYKLLQRIGEGGMGVVYMAEQEEPVRRRVALKIIKLGMDTKQVVARFEAERQALALMDHPNIAKVLDGGATETGRPYFVMELVQGVPITEFCDKNRLSAEERVKLFLPVCQALQSAHQKGIIHRDLKPTNILVTLNAGVPAPMVIDFGVAKATNQKLTEKTYFTDYATMIGTPAYMSPEQAEMSGLDVDTRSDIYGLGVLLYELLTGTTPFPDKRLRSASYREMQRIILEEEPERPSTRLSTLAGEQRSIVARNRGASELALGRVFAGDLDWIVMKCLEKDRTRRYATANGLAADLKRHLNNEVVVARPPTTAYRVQKTWRRNKLAFTAAAVVAAALVVGITISSWQAIEAGRARLRADHLLYVADMNLAQQAWEQNNMGWLQRLLDETQNSPDRGFEWYYWQRQTHRALKTLRGHLGWVTSVAFSPDGQRILTGSGDRTAKVWDAASGKELFALKGHTGEVHGAAFFPDGRRIVTGSWDGTARVWDAASGRELVPLDGHGAPILSVAFSPDGQQIAAGRFDGTVEVWEAARGHRLLAFKGHDGLTVSVTFSPDGKRIVTGSFDGTAKVWEVASQRKLLTLTGHSSGIHSVAFSPYGQWIVTGSGDRTAKVWEAASGRERVTLAGHNAAVISVAFSPNGQRILTGSGDGTAKVWEVASGLELLTLKGHRNMIVSAAFSPNGRWIVTGSADQTAKLWDAATGCEPLTLTGHNDAIASVAFSADGRQIVTGSFDQTAKVWDAGSGRELLALKGHSAAIRSVAFSPDGQRIVTGSSDQTARVWDPSSARELLRIERHKAPINAVAFSPDGQRIVTGSWDQTARVCEAGSGRELFILQGHSGQIRSVAFSPDGQRIVIGSDDRTARVWEPSSGREPLPLTGHSGVIKSVAFFPNGHRIVTGSADQTAKLWDAASGNQLLSLEGHSGSISCVTVSSDGRRIVSGSADLTAKVWDAATGRELLTLTGHSNAITSVAVSPDGQRIVTGSEDRTARVWEASSAPQVAAWQNEEKAAAERLAVLRRERTAQQAGQQDARARDQGAIRRWLILAPIPLPAGQSGAQGLDTEQIKGEARPRPSAGDAISIGVRELRWQEAALDDYVLDFNALLGRVTSQSVAYAVCYLQSEATQRGLRMLVGSDDEAKVYLNGKEIYKYPRPRTFLPDLDPVADITLNAGPNVLVFKVVNEWGDWLGSIRLTDAQGNPVKGIKATLEPEGKDSR